MLDVTTPAGTRQRPSDHETLPTMDGEAPLTPEANGEHPRSRRAIGAIIGAAVVAMLIGVWAVSSGGADSAPASNSPSMTTLPDNEVSLLPDPWTVDDRFDCYLKSTAWVAACAYYDLAAADANLRVATEVLAREHDFVELRDSTTAWSTDVKLLCEASRGGGSMDRYMIPWCYGRAAKLRADFIRTLDQSGRLPPNPVEYWGTPIDRFNEEPCSARLTGIVVAEPRGYTVISETSTVDLVLHEHGTVTGTVKMSVELRNDDDTEAILESTDRLYGEMGIKAGGGAYVSHVLFTGEYPATNYGYWWIEMDDTSAEGEMLALFASDARSDLQLSVEPC